MLTKLHWDFDRAAPDYDMGGRLLASLEAERGTAPAGAAFAEDSTAYGRGKKGAESGAKRAIAPPSPQDIGLATANDASISFGAYHVHLPKVVALMWLGLSAAERDLAVVQVDSDVLPAPYARGSWMFLERLHPLSTIGNAEDFVVPSHNNRRVWRLCRTVSVAAEPSEESRDNVFALDLALSNVFKIDTSPSLDGSFKVIGVTHAPKVSATA
jgi:hypothetical protein